MNVLSSVEKDEVGVSDGLVEYECVMSVKWKREMDEMQRWVDMTKIYQSFS